MTAVIPDGSRMQRRNVSLKRQVRRGMVARCWFVIDSLASSTSMSPGPECYYVIGVTIIFVFFKVYAPPAKNIKK